MTERSERIDEEAEESLYENGALTHHRKKLRRGSPATRMNAKCGYGVGRQWSFFIGIDVESTHHVVGVSHSGNRLFDKALPNDENKLRSLISDLKQHSQILLLVVGWPAIIGAFPVA